MRISNALIQAVKKAKQKGALTRAQEDELFPEQTSKESEDIERMEEDRKPKPEKYDFEPLDGEMPKKKRVDKPNNMTKDEWKKFKSNAGVE